LDDFGPPNFDIFLARRPPRREISKNGSEIDGRKLALKIDKNDQNLTSKIDAKNKLKMMVIN
jgi:hypothetical protein